MKKKIIIALLLALILLTGLVGYCLTGSTTNADSGNTPYGFGMTYHRAQLDEKPIIVVFYVDKCPYCQKLAPKLKILNAIYQNTYNMAFVDCNAQENKAMAEDYHVMVAPTIYIADPRIKNRVHIDTTYYDDINLLKRELDRYILVRNLIK